MTVIKSPIIIQQDYLPIKLCERLLDNSFICYKEFFKEDIYDDELNSYIKPLQQKINFEFDTSIKDTNITYETYDTDVVEDHRADNSLYNETTKTWHRNKNIDFTTIVFLKDYNEKTPIDINTEIFGGKLEFPTFNLNIKPEMGTAVTYPSYPNFLNVFTPPKIGTNHILRFSHESVTMFEYNHSNFKGDIKSWFAHLT